MKLIRTAAVILIALASMASCDHLRHIDCALTHSQAECQ